MGMVFENLTEEEMCDLMCGDPEEELEDENKEDIVMSNLEHYFENLLFHSKDVGNNDNKNTLSLEQQEAVELCANYVLYDIFLNRKEFLKYVRDK